jgi:voltage-gated potassium channel
MERRITAMKDHIIVCGYGRMGRLVCQELTSKGTPFVVIEKEANLVEGFHSAIGAIVHGDATSDEALRHAGVERARALITVVASVPDNLYITMSARLLNERLFIVARAEDDRSEEKLQRAGANRAVAPYRIGGTRVAQAVLRPHVVDFIELATRTGHLELQIEETNIKEASPLANQTLLESKLRQEHGLIIVAIKKKNGAMTFNPPPEIPIQPGDVLIALGDRVNLDALERLANGG